MAPAPHHPVDRAQTTQDFAVGIGLFLLAVVFVISLLPTVLSPVDASGDLQQSQAERIAAELVATATDDGERLSLNATVLDAHIETLEPPAANGRVNVTLETLGGESIQRGGALHEGQSAGTWVRVVTTDDGTCDPACRLTVRVW